MLCPLCRVQYSELRTPRLIPNCGHTLCELCLTALLQQKAFNCPDCKSVQVSTIIQNFPKNLSLLALSNSDRRNTNQQCRKHAKRFQAFCQRDRQLVCIDCILGQHRSHPFISVQQALLKECEIIAAGRQACDCVQNKTIKGLQQIQQRLQWIKRQGQAALMEISNFYNQVRRIVNNEEDYFRKKVSQMISTDESILAERQSLLAARIANIKSYREISVEDERTDMEILVSSYRRQQLLDCLSAKEDFSFDYSNSYDVNKQEMMALIVKKISNLKIPRSKPLPKKSKPDGIKQERQKGKGKVKRKQDIVFDLQRGQLLSQQPSDNYLKFLKALQKSQFSIMGQSDTKSLISSSRLLQFESRRREIVLFGGYIEASAISPLKFCLNNQTWECIPQIQISRSKFSAQTIDGHPYLLGGKKGGMRVSDCQIYKPGKGLISAGFKLSCGKSGFGSVAVAGIVFVIGGNDGKVILNTTQGYNVRTGGFKRLADLRQKRDQLAVVLGRDNKIYAIGGCGGSQSMCLNSVQSYDIQRNEWKPVAPLNIARRALGAAALADGIYAVGGFDGNVYLNSVQHYDQTKKRWTQIQSMNQSRCTHSVTAVHDYQAIYVFGGFDNKALNSGQFYRAATGRWESLPEMPVSLCMHSAVYVG